MSIGLAENIAIDRYGLLFNGERFPFYITDDGVTVKVDDHLGKVTVTFPAESVTVSPLVEIDADGVVALVALPAFED